MRRRLLSTRRFSTTAAANITVDLPSPTQPPLYHPRRLLRVFILPNLTPFLHSYILMRRITHHRLLHDKHTPPHSRSTDEREADWLLVSQPTSVYTMGRAAKLRHVRLNTAPIDCTSLEQATTLLNQQHNTSTATTQPQLLRVDRGGETTWHGPGQLLLYPLINLHHTRCDLHHYLRALESATATALHSLPLTPSTPIHSDPHYTGVWRDGRKLAAIGVGCSRWHTTHGVALNVDIDRSVYELITPCGIEEAGRSVGSVREEWEAEGRQWVGAGEGEVGGYGMVREAVVRELGVQLGMECRVEEESVESVLQRWDEADATRRQVVVQSTVVSSALPTSVNASVAM